MSYKPENHCRHRFIGAKSGDLPEKSLVARRECMVGVSKLLCMLSKSNLVYWGGVRLKIKIKED